MTWQLFDIW